MRDLSIITINRPGLASALALARTLRGPTAERATAGAYRVTIYARLDSLPESTNNADASDHPPIIEYGDLDDLLTSLWTTGNALLFFLATGIVVRKIAPLLGSKFEDPAVLVMDFSLRHVLPLLSGHAGGANDIARDLSARVPGCETFLTTATDQCNGFAFDMFALKQGFHLENGEMVARISNALLNGERVKVFTHPALRSALRSFPGFSEDQLELHDMRALDTDGRDLGQPGPCVILSPSPMPANDCLRIRIRPIAIGCGMNRGTAADAIEAAVLGFLREHQLRLEDVQCIASFSAKQNELGLLEFAARRSLALVFFDEQQINEAGGSFSESRATEFFHVKGVAEPCAVLGSQRGILFQRKQARGEVTVAAAF